MKEYERYLKESRVLRASGLLSNEDFNISVTITMKRMNKNYEYMKAYRSESNNRRFDKEHIEASIIDPNKKKIHLTKQIKRSAKRAITGYLSVHSTKLDTMEMPKTYTVNLSSVFNTTKNLIVSQSYLTKILKELRILYNKTIKFREILIELLDDNGTFGKIKRKFHITKVMIDRVIMYAQSNKFIYESEFQILLKKVSVLQELGSFLNNTTLNDKSVNDLCREYLEKHPLFKISKSSYYLMLKALGLKYLKTRKLIPENQQSIKGRQYFMRKFIEKLNDKDYVVPFFDITSLHESSFKKMNWCLPGLPTSFKKQFNYNLTHIMTLISNDGHYYYQFTRGTLINMDLIDFLRQVVDNLKRLYSYKKIVIVLDNAKMHKTAYFTNFVLLNDIELMFTVANHPMLNCIEYLFRFIKMPFKCRSSMQ